MQGTLGVTSPTRTSIKTVQLSPATCKSLNEVAAQLWIMAYHQQYTPKQEESLTEHSVEHLTQVLNTFAYCFFLVLALHKCSLPCLCLG